MTSSSSTSVNSDSKKPELPHILVIEREKYDNSLMRELLSGVGNLHIAEPGAKLLQLAQELAPKIVIVSLDLKDKSGIQVCRQLKKANQETRLVVMTSATTDINLLRELRSIADGHLIKPFASSQLRSLVDHLLESSGLKQVVECETTVRTKKKKRATMAQRAVERIAELPAAIQANLHQLPPIEAKLFSALKMIVESNDASGGHLLRVAAFSRRIAQELRNHEDHVAEITDSFLTMLHCACQLHDVGNTELQKQIMKQPRGLTEFEYSIVQRHAEIGGAIFDEYLSQNPDSEFLSMSRDVALSHHERWNGTGYPRGIAGTDIPLSARIVSVADVFDALTSDREFRKAYKPDVARNIISNEADRQFDPHVVAAFNTVYRDLVVNRDAMLKEENKHSSQRFEDAGEAKGNFEIPLQIDGIPMRSADSGEMLSRPAAAHERLSLPAHRAGLPAAGNQSANRLRQSFLSGRTDELKAIAFEIQEQARNQGDDEQTRCARKLLDTIERHGSIAELAASYENLMTMVH